MRIVDINRPVGEPLQSLLDDLHRLVQLIETHQEAIVVIALRAERNFELKMIVAAVGKSFSHVIIYSGRSENRAG